MSDTQRSVVCPACGGKDLYVTVKTVHCGGGYAPNLLPGLHRWFNPGAFRAVLCADCGLHRMFAEPESRVAVRKSPKWRQL